MHSRHRSAARPSNPIVRFKSLLIVFVGTILLSMLFMSSASAGKHHARHHRHAQALHGSLKSAHAKLVKIVLKGGKGGGTDPGDDYPAALKNRPQDSALDPWKEYNRECTSFVAWALFSRNGFTMPFYANANQWGPKAIARGYAVNPTPSPGSVAWSNHGTFGHVAYVEDVIGGAVHIEEYNEFGNGTYNSRTVPSSTFTGYIHFRDQAAPAPAPPAGAPPSPTPPPSPVTPPLGPPPTYPETVGGLAHTWTNYSNAGGTQGPSIPSNTTVQIACKVTGFKVADGNTWWYRIASSPWNSAYYVSADAFYNNRATSGSLIGTPFVDPTVPNC